MTADTATARWDAARQQRASHTAANRHDWRCLYPKCRRKLPAGRVGYCSDGCSERDRARIRSEWVGDDIEPAPPAPRAPLTVEEIDPARLRRQADTYRVLAERLNQKGPADHTIAYCEMRANQLDQEADRCE